MTLISKVLCQTHAVSSEVLNVILFAFYLPLDCQTAVLDSFLNVSALLVHLGAVEVGLS